MTKEIRTILPPEERVGYAVIGLGELTTEELLPAFRLSGRSRLAAIVSGDRDEALQKARQHGLSDADVYSYEQFEELRGREDVQAVFIVLPNSLHREYAERAARIGKHVLCEKPLSDTPENAEAMVRACREAGVRLMTAYRIQYTPHHQLARELIERGELGRVKLINSVNTQVEANDGQWRLKRELAGGGSLPDVGLYCLNTARFLTGEEPYEVFAYTHSTPGDPRFKEVEESVSFILRFPSGIIANCLTSYGAAQHRALTVYGEDANLSLDPAFTYTNLRVVQASPEAATEHLVREVDQFALELDHFSMCVQEDLTPYTPGEEGLQDQRILAALYQSAEQGRPVQLERLEGRDLFRGTPPVQPDRQRS
ncbi:Gfo/Idh/MocA family oxidoreductase [Deinococcus sonorensis]|uniref:Gfo/Idh/MocA family oxidoreductase n=2 Tax=Deinococcus sonorensis TaxID=309891 RepID=A0AAU7UE60_9DEIO